MEGSSENKGMDLQQFASDLVNATRDYIFIRPEDGLIILRPNRIHHLNPMATLMLQRLYNRPEGPAVEELVDEIGRMLGGCIKSTKER